MVLNSVRIIAASFVVFGTLGAPAVGSAQYVTDDQPSVVVECGPGQRAVMEQRRINGRTQVVARCEGTQVRPVARRSTVQYAERAPERTKTKTALMIGGSAATGAGVGGALKGKQGAIIGAAIGGGSAAIYEAAKRR
jgi:hypothetical protein